MLKHKNPFLKLFQGYCEDWDFNLSEKQWHLWFAWFPVRAQDDWVWLKPVQRKSEFFHFYDCGDVTIHWYKKAL